MSLARPALQFDYRCANSGIGKVPVECRRHLLCHQQWTHRQIGDQPARTNIPEICLSLLSRATIERSIVPVGGVRRRDAGATAWRRTGGTPVPKMA
ncbi:MAG: hypothetical protein KME26_10040 [Oscillatoria princeps RMCB-10]|nr:hypothetical protein [Oscillatoria princeps RMCB-10]